MDGIFLSLFTILPSLLTTYITNGAVSLIAWSVKTAGSLWLLFRFMKKWAAATGATSAFGYGFKVCLCSAVICASWTFVLYQFIAPDKVAEVMSTLETALGSQASINPEVEDILLLFEDNFAQFNGISILIGCILYGLIFSAIFSRSAAAANIFSNQEKNNQEEEEL